jgi:hypothetical protein
VLLVGVVVFVEGTVESITSSHLKTVQSVRFGDRLGEWAEWSCGV